MSVVVGLGVVGDGDGDERHLVPRVADATELLARMVAMLTKRSR